MICYALDVENSRPTASLYERGERRRLTERTQ
jgi:hypothetical protein